MCPDVEICEDGDATILGVVMMMTVMLAMSRLMAVWLLITKKTRAYLPIQGRYGFKSLATHPYCKTSLKNKHRNLMLDT